MIVNIEVARQAREQKQADLNQQLRDNMKRLVEAIAEADCARHRRFGISVVVNIYQPHEEEHKWYHDKCTERGVDCV